MASYDVAVVGSGYGGSVVAARLAGRRRVLLVERGRRWSTDEFPRGLANLARLYLKRDGTGLWAMRLGKGVGNAFVSAYGGASIVNYGITIQPEDHAFEDWPISAAELRPYYQRALDVLRPERSPVADQLGDKAFLDVVEPGRRVDLANTIDWSRCVNCGNCILGCRHGAKRSLDRTYLAMAEASGAEVRAETTLVQFAPEGDGVRLLLRHTGRDGAEEVHARELVLAAGTFGTIDLLLAHRDRLVLSPRFGQGMGMNGDGAAFLYNTRFPLHPVNGAPITTAAVTHFVDETGRTRTLTIMSGRIPEALMGFSSWVMGTLAELVGQNRGPVDALLSRASRRLRDLWGHPPEGALAHTFMYKLDAQDSASGRLGRDGAGRAAIDWETYQQDPILKFAARKLEGWADRVGGRLVPNIAGLPLMRSFGVHPLGGCGMGRSFADGVTDSYGRIFAPGGGFYPGLRVVDVPPSLTVSALAERAAEQMLEG
jgi:cholesterol oxidase